MADVDAVAVVVVVADAVADVAGVATIIMAFSGGATKHHIGRIGPK